MEHGYCNNVAFRAGLQVLLLTLFWTALVDFV